MTTVLVMTVSNEKKIVNPYNIEILALVGATQKERFDYRLLKPDLWNDVIKA